jgi:Zn-dependent protease with chaperone function
VAWFAYRVLSAVSQARKARGTEVAGPASKLEKSWWLLIGIPASFFATLLVVGVTYKESLISAGVWTMYRAMALPATGAVWVTAYWLYLYGVISVSRARRAIHANEPGRNAAGEALRRTVWIMGIPVLWALMLTSSSHMHVTARIVTVLGCIMLLPIVYARASSHLLPVRTLDDPEMRADIIGLAARAGISFRDVLVVEDDDDPTSTDGERNAMALGWGRSRKILITSYLIHSLAPREVLAVVAHECAHLVKHHVLKCIAVVMLLWGGIVAADAAGSHYLPSPLAALAVWMLAALGFIALRLYQRRTEAEADALAGDWVGPCDMAAALEHLLEDEPPRRRLAWLRNALATHPSKSKRLTLLRQGLPQNPT